MRAGRLAALPSMMIGVSIAIARSQTAAPATGASVRWLVGHVRRGARSWIFVSNVAGNDQTPALAAVRQAEAAPEESHVLR